jgi:hypothetical protein
VTELICTHELAFCTANLTWTHVNLEKSTSTELFKLLMTVIWQRIICIFATINLLGTEPFKEILYISRSIGEDDYPARPEASDISQDIVILLSWLKGGVMNVH